MVRLGKSFACAVLLVSALFVPGRKVTAQAATPQAAPAQPAATAKPASASATTTAPTHKTRARHKKAAPVAEVPQTPPPPPPTLEQQAPTAPRVSYRNGQLMIDAPNSTLASILRAVQLQTGASMDIPAGANSERVVIQLGPGQPKDVLNTLLNGSKFDYVILGVVDQPGAIQKVILTPRQPGAAITTQAANTSPQPEPSEEPDDNIVDTSGESEYPGPDPGQQPVPPGGFRRPMGAPGGQQFQQMQQQQQQQQQNPFGQGESDNVVKTPEQLMQELQQMQQQQEQYQQQLNPANQNPQ